MKPTLTQKPYRTLFFLTITLTILLASTVSHASDLVFDAITGIDTFISSPGTPRTYMGQVFSTGTYSEPRLRFSQLDTVLYSNSTQVYQDVRLRVVFWNNYVGANVVDANSVFSVQAFNSIYTIDLGPMSLTANTAYVLTGLTLPVPVEMQRNNEIGVALNWRGDTGSGLVSTDNLTTAVRGGTGTPGLAVGTSPVNGYFRNASGRTDFNFAYHQIAGMGTSELRTVGDHSALAIRLYAAPAPEASGVMLLGGVGLLSLLRRRRKE